MINKVGNRVRYQKLNYSLEQSYGKSLKSTLRYIYSICIIFIVSFVSIS